MVKGEQVKDSGFTNNKYVGFTALEVKAINPTKKELNKLLGIEDTDQDKELVYLDEDKEQNRRVRLVFWLFDSKLNKFFPYQFYITDKERLNKEGDKHQYINNVCQTAWADVEDNLGTWFTEFTNKEKEVTGKKTFRKALSGEEELAVFLRAWLGKLNWYDAGSDVTIDSKPLFKEKFGELRDLIDCGYDAPFTALIGIRTDKNDDTKQYQQVYGKSFLPGSYMSYINKGFKFPDYPKKIWNKFEAEVSGDHGFDAFHELCPLKVYDPSEDAAQGNNLKKDITPANSAY